MSLQDFRFAKNTLLIIGGKMIVFALSFAFITGLANLAPQDTVGNYNYIMAVLSIVSIATLPGMNTALVRAVARGYEGSLAAMTRLRLKFGLIGSFIAFVVSMVYAFQGNTILACAFFIGAFFVPFTDTVSETSQYFFQGKKLYGKSAMVAIATQALFSLPTLCVLFFSDSLILIVATFWVFQAIAGIIIYSTIRPSNELVDPDSTRFGFHLTWMSGLKTVASNIDRVLVWTILGPASVAIYVIANTPFMKLEQLIPIEALTLPELSNQTFTSLLRKQLLIRTGIGLLVMIPVVAIGYFVTPFVFRILFPTFTESIPLFQLLLVGLFFTPFAFLKTGLVAWRKQKALYVLEIISPIIRIALFVVLGIKLGLLGIIIASVVSRGIDGIITGIAFIKSSHES